LENENLGSTDLEWSIPVSHVTLTRLNQNGLYGQKK
jgi:hypothetical protein